MSISFIRSKSVPAAVYPILQMETLIQRGPAATLGRSAGVQKGTTGILIFKAGAFHHAHTSQARRWMAPRTHGRNARGPLTNPGGVKDEHNASSGESNASTTEGGKVCLQQKKKRKNRHITEYSVKFLLNFKIKLNGL